jgi:ABC-type branched-subunit amino acid transport system substrate-binding protein
MSGSQSSTGIDMFQGAELAVNQLNAAGGVDGVKLRLLKADDAASPTTGATVSKQMVNQHAFGVVGPYNSSVGVRSLPIYRSAGLSILRLTSARTTQGYGVTNQPMDVQVAPVEVNEITQVLHANRVAIIYDTSTYTSGIASSVRDMLAAGGHPAVSYQSITEGQSDFSGVLSTAAAGHPDLLYIAAYGTEAGQLARQASQSNVGGICFTDGLSAQGSDFVSAATIPVAQRCVSSGVPSAQQFAGAGQYVSAYQAAYHTAPGTWGTFTYDSINLLAQAVRSAGGWNEATVQSRLDHTVNFQGITGSTTIEPQTGNRANSPVVILNIDASGNYVINPAWAQATGFPLPPPPSP